tara:strand:- start:687 stop:923 length:237 start_codon:yes stop_codon:yes gene_type:complete
MKYLIITLLCASLLTAESKEVGRYQLETTTYISKKGTVYIVETVLDTKTGKVVTRRKKKASNYKLPYKDRRNNIIREE